MSSPTVIIGMHRSGTTMLVDILEKNGFYFGDNYGKNKEAHPFLAMHEKILRIFSSSWDNPDGFINCKISEKDEILRSVISNEINKKHFNNFFRKKKSNWGWKDPRTSFFLQQWNEIYPQAKFIFIYRDPYYVARSLVDRASREALKIESQLTKKHHLSLFLNKLRGKSEFHLNSELCKCFFHSLDLWNKYNTKCTNFLDTIDNERFIFLKYEELVSNKNSLSELSDFLNININVEDGFFKLPKTHVDIHKGTEFSVLSSRLLNRFGYE